MSRPLHDLETLLEQMDQQKSGKGVQALDSSEGVEFGAENPPECYDENPVNLENPKEVDEKNAEKPHLLDWTKADVSHTPNNEEAQRMGEKNSMHRVTKRMHELAR